MASTHDLQEQEQLAQLKHFWSRYGNVITWVLIAAMASFAAWNGWKFWERRAAQEATALFAEIERAAAANDVDRVQRVWADMQSKVARSAQTAHGGLLAARVLHEAGSLDAAKQALQVVADTARDTGVVAVARLRLSALELEQSNPAAALQSLSVAPPPEFAGLFADRRGDILLAQGQVDEARQAYLEAWRAISAEVDYRRIVEAKLNALGVNPSDTKP